MDKERGRRWKKRVKARGEDGRKETRIREGKEK